jgi:hypothetical protein
MTWTKKTHLSMISSKNSIMEKKTRCVYFLINSGKGKIASHSEIRYQWEALWHPHSWKGSIRRPINKITVAQATQSTLAATGA